MDSIVNSVDDRLVDGLSYKLGNSSSYITDRREVSFFASGSDVYTPVGGTRVIRVNLTGDNWLVPHSLRLFFTLVNTDANPTTKLLRPIGGPWSFFQRMRVLCGGQIVEDITGYNRVHEMINKLQSEESNQNDAAEGFGARYDSAIKPELQERYRVCFKPLSGLLTQNKLVPLRYGNLTLEFELVSAMDDVIYKVGSPGATAENTSETWRIEDVQVKASVCTLDNSLENQIAQHLNNGQPLPINFHTFITAKHTLTSASGLIQVNRSLSHLSAVFISFDSSNRSDEVREWNNFVFPGDEQEFQLQIGSKKFPEMKMTSKSEVFSKLRDACRDLKPLAVHGSVYGYTASRLNNVLFTTKSFIIGINTSKIEGSHFTGYNMKDGSTMSLEYKTTTGGVNAMNFVMLSDQIWQIRNSGVDVVE